MRRLERLYHRRRDPEPAVPPDLAQAMAEISWEAGRQIGVLMDRRGRVTHVMVGDHHSILIPDLSGLRRGRGRLKGLRLIHTHLGSPRPLDHEDLMDLALLRLDLMAAVEVEQGRCMGVHLAHLLPPNPQGETWRVEGLPSLRDVPRGFPAFVAELEEEIERGQAALTVEGGEERAILIHASPLPREEAERSLAELRELARSAGVAVVEMVHQRVQRYHPAHLMGRGKLRELLIRGLYLGATMVIFDQELSPVQVNNIAELVDLKVIDRTQLILDIFAQRARSREGKIQVELAQLRYLLPRLVGRGTAMSRLMGGIGGRGPGETKLEIHRRRVRERIASLERQLKGLSRGRLERRKRRCRRALQVSIVGYTNAGKSTLLNRLTSGGVAAEDRLFATLDPTARRLRLPCGREVVVTDTVGFIRRMPHEIKVAFRATLEELKEADLLIHVVDLTSPRRREEMEAVEAILAEMGLSGVPTVVVFNKMDLADGPGPEGGLAISAVTGQGLDRLLEELCRRLSADPRRDT